MKPSPANWFSVLIIGAFLVAAAVSAQEITVSGESTDASLWDAQLSASITIEDDSAVSFFFEWGLSTNYENQTLPVALQGPQSSSIISDFIAGLTPYTTYHFQAIASNATGVVLGGDSSFTTLPRFVQVNDYTGWSSVALSADGKELVATSNDIICVSTNLGVTFNPTDGVGEVFAVSSNGQTILSVSGSNLLVSLDKGARWATNTTPIAFTRWATTYDAQGIIAGDGGATVYRSTNLGGTWAPETYPLGISCMALSSNAAYLVAYNNDMYNPFVYCYGPDTTSMWNSTGVSAMACSYDGTEVIVMSQAPAISYNSGETFGDFLGVIFDPIFCVACSADGNTIIIGGWPWVSPDGGRTIYEVNGPFGTPYISKPSMCSADGRTLGFLDSGIYLSLPLPSQPTAISATISNGVPKFTLKGQPGYTFVVQASTDLISWSNIATVVNTNGTVPFVDPASASFGARFYRAILP